LQAVKLALHPNSHCDSTHAAAQPAELQSAAEPHVSWVTSAVPLALQRWNKAPLQLRAFGAHTVRTHARLLHTPAPPPCTVQVRLLGS
jgi:hypothetical protein